MKKLLGFFSIIGVTTSVSTGVVQALAENNLDWTTPTSTIDSVIRLVEKRAFKSNEDFQSFINSEVYNRFTNVLDVEARSFKLNDILLTYKIMDKELVELEATLYTEISGIVQLDKTTTITKMIGITLV